MLIPSIPASLTSDAVTCDVRASASPRSVRVGEEASTRGPDFMLWRFDISVEIDRRTADLLLIDIVHR